MLNFEKLFQKEKWALVKTFEFEVESIGGTSPNQDGILYIHCFESNKGNRKIETKCGLYGVGLAGIERWALSNDFYQKTIFRWLSGRNDPAIPGYSEIAEEDTANYLRGKV